MTEWSFCFSKVFRPNTTLFVLDSGVWMKTDGKWKNTEGTLLEVNDRRIFLLFYGFRQNTHALRLDRQRSLDELRRKEKNSRQEFT